MNNKHFIFKILFISMLVIAIVSNQSLAQTRRVFKPIKDFSLDSIKINGYIWNWDNYKLFNKYKVGVTAEVCINDTSLTNWYSLEDFEKIRDTAKVYFVAQEITIPKNLFNMPVFRSVSSNVEKIWQNGKLVYDFTINDNKKFFDHIIGIEYPFSFSKEKNIIVHQVNSKGQRKLRTYFGSMFASYFTYINYIQTDHDSNVMLGTLSSFLLAVSLMLFFIYLFGIREKKYLWGTGFNFSLSIGLFSFTGFFTLFETEVIGMIFLLISPYFLVQFIYSLYNYQLPKWVKKTLFILSLLLICFMIMLLSEIEFFENILEKDENGLSILIPVALLFVISSTFVFIGIYKAIKQKLNNAWILFIGLLLIIALTVFWLYDSTLGGEVLSITNWYKVLHILPMPMCVLITIVRDYVSANKNLKTQLIKVEELTAQTIKEQGEKQQILAFQNEKLEHQVTERTKEINEQKHLLLEKQKEMFDSISYAKRLQEAILPPQEFINSYIPDNFILYKPKDLVAGDFYWAEHVGDKFFIAAADSTGHGVPGCMVSVVCSNALNRSVKEFNLTDTGKILDKTRELVLETFAKSTSDVKDGMDISLLSIDTKNKQLFWSGANNPLWYIEDNELKEIKADKQPIGKSDHAKPFTTHQIDYKENTTFYLFTDGFADQFGGPKGKKFKYKPLSDLLVLNNNFSFQEQGTILDKTFSDWKGDLEQVDDVCVIGLKL